MTEKRSRRGKSFFGCSDYAKKNCDFVLWDRPIRKECPACGAKFMVKKETSRSVTLRCTSCDYRESAENEQN